MGPSDFVEPFATVVIMLFYVNMIHDMLTSNRKSEHAQVAFRHPGNMLNRLCGEGANAVD